jgi:hypothetical protein
MAQPQQPQRPQGLLGSLGIQRRDPNAQGETSQPFYNRQSFGDTLARMAPALGRMGVMGLEGPMQAQLDTRNQRQGDERAQAMLDTQRNQTIEWLVSNGREDLAGAVQSGGLPIGDAMSIATSPAATSASFEGQRQQALAGGLVEGTPEYQNFMLNGPTPSNMRALEMQAEAAGLEPGTEGYQRYMLTRGAYDTAFDRTAGGNIADTETARAAEIQRAEGSGIGAANATDEIRLREMQRNLPGLMGVVDRLDALSGTATFSRVEVAADSARRALGQEVSAGGIARAEYIATVDNEILPLLRQTFGAAFTVEEGARLRATLGNEDGTPAERRATLNAFIQQKQAELESFGGSMPAPAPPAGGSIDVDPALLEFMTPEERALFQ